MKQNSDAMSRKITGYAAGIAAGASYGLNPLFAKPLMEGGMPVTVMLMFRYLISVLLLALMMGLKREDFRIGKKELPQLVILGILFAFSSIFLLAFHHSYFRRHHPAFQSECRSGNQDNRDCSCNHFST